MRIQSIHSNCKYSNWWLANNYCMMISANVSFVVNSLSKNRRLRNSCWIIFGYSTVWTSLTQYVCRTRFWRISVTWWKCSIVYLGTLYLQVIVGKYDKYIIGYIGIRMKRHGHLTIQYGLILIVSKLSVVGLSATLKNVFGSSNYHLHLYHSFHVCYFIMIY